jgi:hypothetical protein
MANPAMHYKVIFDIEQTPYQHWSGLFVGFVFFVVATGFFWFHWRSAKRTGNRYSDRSVFLALFLGFWSLSPIFWCFYCYQNYLDLKTALQQSRCEIAEGAVTHLHPLGRIRKGSGAGETFSVGGNEFSYRAGSAQNGFHQIGILHDGMQVRIHYYDRNDNHNKDIARLEIAP